MLSAWVVAYGNNDVIVLVLAITLYYDTSACAKWRVLTITKDMKGR